MTDWGVQDVTQMVLFPKWCRFPTSSLFWDAIYIYMGMAIMIGNCIGDQLVCNWDIL